MALLSAGIVAFGALNIACVPPAAGGAPVAMAHSPSAPVRLVLNIPAFRLDVFLADEQIKSYRVAVGSRKYPTPVGEYAISEITWNPWWRPPDSGWARRERPAPPGPKNPLGRVKLTFRSLYHLHGTPDEESLGRAASHGCVRLANQDVIALARMLHGESPSGPDEARLDALEADPRLTASFALRPPVPLQIVYRLAEVHDGQLAIHPDVYRRGTSTVRAHALTALEGVGITRQQVDEARLDQLLQAGRRNSTSAPVAELTQETLSTTRIP